MEISPSDIDARENTVFLEVITKLLEETPEPHKSLKTYQRAILNINPNAEPEEAKVSLRYYYAHPEYHPKLVPAMKTIATQAAIAYFKALHTFLENLDEELIEALARKVRLAAAVLLRQTENCIPELKPPRQNDPRSTHSLQNKVHNLFHFDRISIDTDFKCLRSERGINHYAGLRGEGRHASLLFHNTHSGIGASDILCMLSSDSDCRVYEGVEGSYLDERTREERHVATIYRDGIIELIQAD